MAATRLTRKLLGEFLKNPETIRAFENLDTGNNDLESVVAQMRDAAVLVLSLTDAFSNQRVVTSDGEVEVTDGGPGGTLTFGLSDTGVSGGNYGDASHLVQIAINAKGRITLASSIPLNSDNVVEGGTNLYFTNTRARTSLSSGVGMAYNSTTGAIDVGATLAAYAGGDMPSAFTLGIMDSVDGAAWRAAIGAGTSTVTPSALTKVDDTNVTLTLGGSPSTSLLAATSLTLGWTGTLSVARGGTGLASFTANGVFYASSTSAISQSANFSFDGTNLFVGTSSSLGSGTLHVRGGVIGDTSVGDGNLRIEARSGTLISNSIYNSTTAASPDVTCSGIPGILQRSTSSARYKRQVETLTEEMSAKIYQMRPVWYRSKCKTDRKDWSWLGLIAEELAPIEPRLVRWGAPDENGQQIPEGVMYDRLVVPLLAEVQKLRAELDEMKVAAKH